MQSERIKRYRKGLWAEMQAACFLWCKGYRILAWRYKTPVGEIDLVARKKSITVFVEVKARKTRDVGLDSVTASSWQRIARAAAHFQRARPHKACRGWRYDLVVVTRGRLPYHQCDTYRPDRM